MQKRSNGISGIKAIGVTPEALVGLAHSYGTPLLVTSQKRLEGNYARLRSAFEGGYGNVSIKYAVKANSNLTIIRLLARQGAGIDASSVQELEFAFAAGVRRERIMFSPNYASRSELEYALNADVTINFDDIGQFEALSGIGIPERVSFRVDPGIGKGEFPGTTLSGPDSKFGIPEREIVRGFKAAKDCGARRFGIHMMCGSNVLDPAYFGAITSRILDIAGRLKAKLGISVEFIDIGGGFGVPYGPGQEPLDIKETARLVTAEFRSKAKKYGLGEPQLMMEPGRYLVADTTVLLGTVNHVKRYAKTFVGTDIGMNLLLRPALYGAYHEIAVVTRPNEPPSITADVVGEVCENTDFIARDRRLPAVSAGDIIAVMNAGAYVYGMSSQYNGRPRPAEVLITSSGKSVMTRRRETTADLMLTSAPEAAV